MSNQQTMWCGTYPAEGPGIPSGEGIWRVTVTANDDSEDIKDLSVETVQAITLASPSFVLHHPELPLLYAVSEEEETVVSIISVRDPANSRIETSVLTGGRHGCHLLLARDARTLYVTHYSSGDIVVIPLDANGLPVPDQPIQSFGHAGSGPRKDRQEGPHAHFVGHAPGGDHLLVADLGTDELRRYGCAPDGRLRSTGIAATLPPGSGPRHFAVRGNHIYLVCELDHLVRTLVWDPSAATAIVVDELPSTLSPLRTGDTIYDGHIEIVGDTVLVSVRGCNVISVFDMGDEGRLVRRAAFDSGGVWPRHFATSEGRLVVGNQHTHDISIFDLADVLSIRPDDKLGEVQQLPHVSAGVTGAACIAGSDA